MYGLKSNLDGNCSSSDEIVFGVRLSYLDFLSLLCCMGFYRKIKGSVFYFWLQRLKIYKEWGGKEGDINGYKNVIFGLIV